MDSLKFLSCATRIAPAFSNNNTLWFRFCWFECLNLVNTQLETLKENRNHAAQKVGGAKGRGDAKKIVLCCLFLLKYHKVVLIPRLIDDLIWLSEYLGRAELMSSEFVVLHSNFSYIEIVECARLRASSTRSLIEIVECARLRTALQSFSNRDSRRRCVAGLYYISNRDSRVR